MVAWPRLAQKVVLCSQTPVAVARRHPVLKEEYIFKKKKKEKKIYIKIRIKKKNQQRHKKTHPGENKANQKKHM